jgi:hypothetical protein
MEQERTFTQEQAQIMYRALFILSEGFFTTESQGYARDTLDHMHELDSAPEADELANLPAWRDIVPERYVARKSPAGDWWNVETEHSASSVMVCDTEAEAQTHAEYLNAASEVQG